MRALSGSVVLEDTDCGALEIEGGGSELSVGDEDVRSGGVKSTTGLVRDSRQLYIPIAHTF
jgi:hypothetical protein